eukprot:Gregarina_sp_Pseudo_9__2231@NODE_256_length_3405_cov_38_774510_g239_i0_p5_GENE_NODE_256_length_3405_cov_38_774510_g239_i0NODE_256_length_3405_cov_38_774510_g239_i0_p5_ORF_typecomplete_len120_score3_16_NODE_256_length_3405_cov_38_774510_g239_i024742833
MIGERDNFTSSSSLNTPASIDCTGDHFPVIQAQSSKRLAEEMRRFLEEEETLERFYESEICRRNVQEVVKSLSLDRISFRMPEDAISPYLQRQLPEQALETLDRIKDAIIQLDKFKERV